MILRLFNRDGSDRETDPVCDMQVDIRKPPGGTYDYQVERPTTSAAQDASAPSRKNRTRTCRARRRFRCSGPCFSLSIKKTQT